MSWSGHFWTLGPFLRHTVRPPRVPESRHWQTTVRADTVGEVSLTGRLSCLGEQAADRVVVVIHGLGGSANSYYALMAAQAAARAGIDSLRLNLRGADREGNDFYHAGQTADLEAALSSPALRHYREVLLLSYSMGGNMMLRYLAGDTDPRVRAAATLCAPIDLAASARALDQPQRLLYRLHVLRSLKEIYREVTTKRRLPVTAGEASRIVTIEEWDERIVAPHHGFLSAADYWAQTSACQVLSQISIPTLFVASEHDPMVLIETIRPWLNHDGTIRQVVTTEGGHVGFPRPVDLGIGEPGAVEDQLIRWLLTPE